VATDGKMDITVNVDEELLSIIKQLCGMVEDARQVRDDAVKSMRECEQRMRAAEKERDTSREEPQAHIERLNDENCTLAARLVYGLNEREALRKQLSFMNERSRDHRHRAVALHDALSMLVNAVRSYEEKSDVDRWRALVDTATSAGATLAYGALVQAPCE